MKTRYGFLAAAALAVLVVGADLAALPPDLAVKRMELSRTPFDRAAHLMQMEKLQQRLSERTVELALEAPLQVEVTQLERESVRLGVLRQQKMRVGVTKDLYVPVGFSRGNIVPFRATLHDSFGAVRGEADGGFRWSGVVRSPEASALRIHITDMDLPAGAALYVHAANGMAFGPYTGRGPNGTGDFWTNTVAGAELRLELEAGVIGTPRFTVAGIGHMTDEFGMARNLAPRPSPMAGTAPCSFNRECVVDAACGTENAAVNTAKNAVAHMLFASGGFLYICSGGLVADSDASTNVPYFITAAHCINSSGEASSLETFFFYTASSCGACPDPGAAATVGSSLVATGKTSDFTLLRLSQAAPSGAAFLGWSNTPIANTNGVNLYRISHPGGAPQAYSEHVVDTSKPTCRSWPRGSWIYSRDILGATEGGSSGSPVVNGAGQLVGQLSGGCGFNVNDECDAASNATVDGAFAAYYANVASFLGSGDGGGGGCTDADGDGVCASEGDCNDNDARIYPGANDTKGKAGRDGVDNDCDGQADA